MRRRDLALSAASAWLLSSLPARAAASRLSLTGSSTVAPLALEIGKRFETLNAGVGVEVQTGGSSRA